MALFGKEPVPKSKQQTFLENYCRSTAWHGTAMQWLLVCFYLAKYTEEAPMMHVSRLFRTGFTNFGSLQMRLLISLRKTLKTSVV